MTGQRWSYGGQEMGGMHGWWWGMNDLVLLSSLFCTPKNAGRVRRVACPKYASRNQERGVPWALHLKHNSTPHDPPLKLTTPHHPVSLWACCLDCASAGPKRIYLSMPRGLWEYRSYLLIKQVVCAAFSHTFIIFSEYETCIRIIHMYTVCNVVKVIASILGVKYVRMMCTLRYCGLHYHAVRCVSETRAR